MSKIALEDIRPFLLNPEILEKNIVKNISEISLKFTQNRKEIKDYVLDRDLVSSYALYYLPTNAPKLHYILEELPLVIKNIILTNTFIDVGCGPGTYSFALAKISEKQNFICVDHAKLMLDQAEKILTNSFKQHQFEFKKKLDGKIEKSTLFFGNSINEMGIQNALDLVNIIDPEVVFFIEPGTSELFLELKKFRANLLNDYDIVYPCPSNAQCEYDWCHQVLRTTHALDVERLSQLVSLDRKIMPLCAHVYVKKNLVLLPKHTDVRIIRFLNETKFSFIYEGCFEHDGKNEISKIEILKKNMNKIMEKKFKNLNIGEKISFVFEKKINDSWRGYVHD